MESYRKPICFAINALPKREEDQVTLPLYAQELRAWIVTAGGI
jgi:hypothetical protein